MSLGCKISQPWFAQYCCRARISPWNERDGSRLAGAAGMERSGFRIDFWGGRLSLILKANGGRDRFGGTQVVQGETLVAIDFRLSCIRRPRLPTERRAREQD